MIAILKVILLALDILIWLVIAMVIYSWLYAFNVINPRNQFVATIGGFLHQITDPLLRPIRRFIPAFNGIDISPIVLFLLIYLLQFIIIDYLMPAVIRAGI